MASRDQFEVIIVGGGIAGAAMAYFLARRGVRDVLIVEREDQPGTHATGRSAAALVESHRHPLVRRLIAAGAAFLRRPPSGFVEEPLLDPVGVIVPARGPAWDEVERLATAMSAEGVATQLLTPDEILARVPVLRRDQVDGGLLLPEDGHIDLHGLLSGYLRHAARGGGELRCGVEVREVLVEGGRCTGIGTSAGPLRARWVVNAAGAWAGELGAMAGATPIAFTPRRRTIITFAAPAELGVSRWPMIDCDSRHLYFKPESGGLLASPMDETPASPGDARPADEDVADAVEKLGAFAPALEPRAIRRKWAGLRTFSPDELPVVGEDPRVPGFFWLAGQGGVGIETSPALGRLAADLLVDGTTEFLDGKTLAPQRFGA